MRRYPIGGRPALSPDGRTLALALNSAVGSGPELRRCACSTCAAAATGDWPTDLPDEWIMSMAFTRDGTRIVAPSFDGTHVWDVASGEIVESYRDGERLDGSGSDIVIDRRGLALFTTGDGTITAWDPDGARRVGRVYPVRHRSAGVPRDDAAR